MIIQTKYCKCKCGQEIVITLNHRLNGINPRIPKYIVGHNSRGRTLLGVSKRNSEGKLGNFEKNHKINLGRKHPPEFGERISKMKLGIKRPKELMKRIGETIRKNGSLKGKKNPNWKGGITSKNKLLRDSSKYKDWRWKVFHRDNFTCQDCGQIKRYIQAHHIKSFAQYPKLRFHIENGLTLCKNCHKNTENFGINIK